MKSLTRRSFLTTGTVALAAVTVPPRLTRGQAFAHTARLTETDPYAVFSAKHPMGSPERKAWIARGLDAARSNGATYADVRLRISRHQRWNTFNSSDNQYPAPFDQFSGGIIVRALVQGYWGYTGIDGIPTLDAMAELGRDAAVQARIASRGAPRAAVLAATPVIKDGQWTTPIEIDPFTVSPDEIIDFGCATLAALGRQRYRNEVALGFEFVKEERSFGSSEGSYLDQTCYTTGAAPLTLSIEPSVVTERYAGWQFNCLTPAGAGWEYVLRAPIQDEFPHVLENAFAAQRRALKPVDVGRYDIVCDAQTTARLLDSTIGVATELDRAMGYEANDLGTSFLHDPLGMLGTFRIGSPLINVAMNRSMAKGAATVGWDEEGVAPVDATLVRDGMLVDFQTTREAASWLEPYYKQRGISPRSNGCAGAEQATMPVAQVPPNFTITPSKHEASFADLVRDVKQGIALLNCEPSLDFQGLNGTARGFMREIKNGELGDIIQDGQIHFRAPEFWRGVSAIGGGKSAQPFGLSRSRRPVRGAYHIPFLNSYHTVSAVPIVSKNVALTDRWRRA